LLVGGEALLRPTTFLNFISPRR